MIVVTGGAGFIGSNLVNHLSKTKKIASIDWNNEVNKEYFKSKKIEEICPSNIDAFLKKNSKLIEIIVHLGAITSTTEKNINLLIKNNIELSIKLFNWCLTNDKRFIYASSAATYGNGNNGFEDKDSLSHLSNLYPMNLYGWSKHIFDKFVSKRDEKPFQCVGLKFFNVYGINEFHKNDMRSIILKIYQKIKNNENIELFKSHNKNYKDGEQMRDFIYVKDVINVICWFIKNPDLNGIFNVGSGEARTFIDLVDNVFYNCNEEKKYKFRNIPEDIRQQYQYYTRANISKLLNTGYNAKFFSLEDGITDYIKNYLIKI